MQETKKYFPVLVVIAALAILSPRFQQPRPARIEGAFIENTSLLPLAANKGRKEPMSLAAGEPAISAEAVLVKDRESQKILFEKNPTETVPVASLAKLMTAITVARRVEFDDTVQIQPEDVRVSPDRAGLVPGERITVRNLLKAMLISSANDAAMALANYSSGGIANFVETMNAEAGRLDMRDTKFANPVGFDDENQRSSARDLAKLVEEFLNYPELVAISGIRETAITSVDGQYRHRLSTTNRLLLEHPEIVGLKTGYTTEARGNLIILVNEPSPWYSILLGSNDREGESEKIFNWVKGNFVWR
ncbi:MAG: D-alanyl-D-alanine carboxypeptidase [Candidatus Doudnabacteria bacterium]|nr:D-alanyl-D-alanine carboxypeptidase [Candidatus Doudnabacteria bacterium]